MPSAPMVFVDESKAKDYLLVAASIAPSAAPECRRAIRRLLLPGQRRVHMKKERDGRRKTILDVIATLDASVTVYRAPRQLGNELLRRDLCLDRLVRDLGAAGGVLCLEREESLVVRDQQCIIEARRAARSRETLTYRHESAAGEPLLAIPDAVGWAWARGAEWRRHAGTAVTGIVSLSR